MQTGDEPTNEKDRGGEGEGQGKARGGREFGIAIVKEGVGCMGERTLKIVSLGLDKEKRRAL